MEKLPTPTVKEVEFYLEKWKTLENYVYQENSLDKLFIDLIPENKVIEDVLIKASTLNDFYSTNIFSIYPVAKHILSLKIDNRLKEGDPTLVDDIANVEEINKRFYSFASKYCSHHNSKQFPIYDSYVEKVLMYFKKRDKFAVFIKKDLKDYTTFKNVLLNFRDYYKLNQFNLKELDQYLWQLGKEYFPKNFKVI